VNEQGDFVGSLNDTQLFGKLIENPDLKLETVNKVVQAPFPFVSNDTPIEEICKLITKDVNAVLVKSLAGEVHIITKQDVIDALN